VWSQCQREAILSQRAHERTVVVSHSDLKHNSVDDLTNVLGSQYSISDIADS
jgi:hypothetical protein